MRVRLDGRVTLDRFTQPQKTPKSTANKPDGKITSVRVEQS